MGVILLLPWPPGATAAHAGEWQIEQELRVDLNADQRPDAVLVMVDPADRVRGAIRPRRLVVLLAEPAGRWRSVAASARLLDENAGSPQLTWTRGVLNIEQEWGSRYKISLTQRFRPDATGRLRFIGDERAILDGSPLGVEGEDGFSAYYSTNLLTGKQHVQMAGKIEVAGPCYRVDQHRQLRLRPLYLEDIDNISPGRPEALRWLPDFEQW